MGPEVYKANGSKFDKYFFLSHYRILVNTSQLTPSINKRKYRGSADLFAEIFIDTDSKPTSIA